GALAGGAHEAEVGQLGDLVDVDLAPDAGRFARGEADGVGLVVEALADAVDPAEAQGLVDGLRPGHAGAAAVSLVEADEELFLRLVVLLEPGAEEILGGEEARPEGLHAAAVRRRLPRAPPRSLVRNWPV